MRILVRPHPQRIDDWREAPPLEGAVVWGSNPVDEGGRADYFDSLYYSAGVVGLNTSALVEAAIVDRPVFTVLAPEFHENQEGTFHFHHLMTVGSGFLNVARSLGEHVRQLAALARGEAMRPNAPFVERFIRPRGLRDGCDAGVRRDGDDAGGGAIAGAAIDAGLGVSAAAGGVRSGDRRAAAARRAHLLEPGEVPPAGTWPTHDARHIPRSPGSVSGRCLVIGEVALAHDGSLGLAHAFIDAIAAAGADAVKFQTHIAAAESTPAEPFRVAVQPPGRTRYDYWRRMEFTEEQWQGLRRARRERGVLLHVARRSRSRPWSCSSASAQPSGRSPRARSRNGAAARPRARRPAARCCCPRA